MKSTIIFAVLFFFVLTTSAEVSKTVSECTKDLERRVFAIGNKKAKKICEEEKQKTVECAIEDYRLRGLGRTFEDSIADCKRVDR